MYVEKLQINVGETLGNNKTGYLYYKWRELYFCSAKAPVLDGSGSRR